MVSVQEFNQKLKQELEILKDKRGIEKYFLPDLNNPLDQEIVQKVRNGNNCRKSPIGEERTCRMILGRRVGGKGIGQEKQKTDSLIKARIQKLCIKHQRSWNDTVRELFCIEFNIK